MADKRGGGGLKILFQCEEEVSLQKWEGELRRGEGKGKIQKKREGGETLWCPWGQPKKGKHTPKRKSKNRGGGKKKPEAGRQKHGSCLWLIWDPPSRNWKGC